VDVGMAQASVSQSPTDAFGRGGGHVSQRAVVGASGACRRWTDDAVVGGGAVIFVLSDVHPVVGRVVSFL
jgi:hypothetical protein